MNAESECDKSVKSELKVKLKTVFKCMKNAEESLKSKSKSIRCIQEVQRHRT